MQILFATVMIFFSTQADSKTANECVHIYYDSAKDVFDMGKGIWTFGAYPMLNGVIGMDTADVSYNRYIDLRSGPRLEAKTSHFDFQIIPEYVIGQYIAGPMDVRYDEWRILGVLYMSI